MSNTRFVFVLASGFVFAAVIGLFGFQNPALVKFNFLAFQVDRVALSILVVGAALLGAALTVVIGLGRELSQRAAISSLRQQLRNQAPAK